mmetsp:Transcript_77448/g.121941  ORF Transcript_77448/g.121941 Transcript_77448/m.121941 type:complete len:359 (-) Transcript_77448:2-1078(-)
MLQRQLLQALLTFKVQTFVGILEQTYGFLDPQDPSNSFVHFFHADLTLGDQVREMFHIQSALHAHVHASGERQARRVPSVRREAVVDQLLVRGVVRDHEAFEPPLFAKDISHKPPVPRGRHAGDVVEGAHERQRARLQRGLEGRQVDVTQCGVRELHEVVLHACGDSAIGGKMFGSGQQAILSCQFLTLEALHARHGKLLTQKDILPGAFSHPTPSLVSGNVHHGSEGPVDPGAGGLQRRGAGRALRQEGLPAAGFGQGNGEDRPHAVDHVASIDQRYTQACFLQCNSLGFSTLLDPNPVEDGAHSAQADLLHHFIGLSMVDLRIDVRIAGPDSVRQNGQLPRFLFQSHLTDELFLCC